VLSLLYKLYEQRLRRQILQRPTPRHVGIILDGNRRYASKQGLGDLGQAYEIGAEKLDEVLEWCIEFGIPAVTLWAFSIDNLRRPAVEVTGILAAVETKIKRLVHDPAIHRYKVRVKAAGRRELLPPSLAIALEKVEAVTAGYDVLNLTIAVAYGGREEITDAIRAFIRHKAAETADLDEIASAVTPAAINEHLYTAGLPDPDLIIRTSGEIRLSGFLLWQSAQSELYFSDVNWPEFRKTDFLRAIRSYQQRKRRFGL
jgi:short-chain Z-isoprenyl diphosphate synthase